MAEKKVEVEIRRNKLIDLNDKLEQRKISMKLKLEKRDKSKNELQMLKVEDQMKELNFYRSKLAETKRSLKEIETVCNENDLKINTKSQEVHDLQIHLKSIEKEYDYNQN